MKKRALFVLGILAFLCLACFFLPDQFTLTLRKETMEVLGPVLRTANTPVTFFSRMDTKLKTLDQAQAEVIRLHQQLAQRRSMTGTLNTTMRPFLLWRPSTQRKCR